MSGVNSVFIVGNVGNEPEIKSFSNGGKVANISVATSESWKDKQTGERKEKAEWHRVVVKNPSTVDFVANNVSKGALVSVQGQLSTRKYEQNGVEKYTTEIVVGGHGGNLTLLSKSAGSAAGKPAAELNDDIPF